MRTLLLILAIAAIYFIIRHQWLQQKAAKTPERQQTSADPVATVKCSYCATHIPANEAIRSNSDYYCSNTHLQLDRKRKSD